MPKNDFVPDISADDLTPIVRAITGGELEGDWKTTAIGDGIGLGTIGIFDYLDDLDRLQGRPSHGQQS